MSAQPQAQMVPIPPMKPKGLTEAEMAVAIVAVVLLALGSLIWFHVLTSSMCGGPIWGDSSRCGNHSGPLLGIGVNVQSTGGNWTLTVSGVSGTFPIDSMRIAIYDANGSAKLDYVGFHQLTTANWPTYHVEYVRQGTETTVVPGARIVIDKATYPAGYRFELASSTSIVATGTLH